MPRELSRLNKHLSDLSPRAHPIRTVGSGPSVRLRKGNPGLKPGRRAVEQAPPFLSQRHNASLEPLRAGIDPESIKLSHAAIGNAYQFGLPIGRYRFKMNNAGRMRSLTRKLRRIAGRA